jgi:hypothetical protein
MHPENKEVWDVLHDDVSGSNLANESGVFSPKTGTLSVDSCLFPGNAEILAGESSADEVNVSPEGSSIQLGNVGMDGGRIQLGVGPGHPMEEYLLRVLFDFAVGNGLESSRLFESITEPSNT